VTAHLAIDGSQFGGDTSCLVDERRLEHDDEPIHYLQHLQQFVENFDAATSDTSPTVTKGGEESPRIGRDAELPVARLSNAHDCVVVE
jgi:hypothetical protein